LADLNGLEDFLVEFMRCSMSAGWRGMNKLEPDALVYLVLLITSPNSSVK